jgi:uncharacterized lipoprotein YddW (UPF0748 family)
MKQFAAFVIVVVLLARLGAAMAGESFQFKTRALWVDLDSFATTEAADRTLARCARAGINTILPNVMYRGNLAFKSPHFHGRVLANDRFDPLACLLRKAHAAGIQVQAWCCVYYEGAGRLSKPEWLTRSFDGHPFEQNFLSPAHPEVNPYLLPVITDLLAYDIDGIHLDYIRYPGTAYDYSEAARKAFQASGGFDPMDFLDHSERIVPIEKEPFPIRVLHAKSQVEKVWETTAIERTLDQAGLGFAFVSETPDNIAALRTPALLILSSFREVSPAMLAALGKYVEHGGNLLWSDVPTGMLRTNVALQKLTGLAGGEWKAKQRLLLQAVADHPLARLVPTQPFGAVVASATGLNGAQLIARLESGEPAITLNLVGKGRVLVLGFDAMESTADQTVSLIKDIVEWFRTQAGVAGPDLLAAKRAEWANWRGEQVTRLVRSVSEAVRRKNPKLVVTSSGGPSPREFYACYRDARRWLAENINDSVFPMNYTPDPAELEEMLETQARFAPPTKFDRIFPGLQIYQSTVVNGRKVSRPADPAIVEQELRLVQQHGYQGFCLFACNFLSDEIIDVVRKFSG